VSIIECNRSRGLAPVYAAKAATSTIPIVFSTAGDAVKYGLVTNLSRPGGNITGVTFFGAELSGKRLELLCEMVPQAKTIAYLSGGSRFWGFDEEWSSVVAAVTKLERKVTILEAPTPLYIDAAFRAFAFPGGRRGDVIGQRQADALIVGIAPHFLHAQEEILGLAARYKVPGVYPGSEWCRRGGLMSYMSDFLALYRNAGQYVGQILNGAKPGDLPIQRSTKFELVINVRTAKALGITVPPLLLDRADEVIE
jgi:putative ABC transport system substrate-binding protein